MSLSYKGPERRANVRQKVFLGAKIIADELFEPFECVIRNLTVDGAYIKIIDNALLPEAFKISIPSKQCVMRAKIIWREAGFAGLYFDGFDFGELAMPAASVNEPDRHWAN